MEMAMVQKIIEKTKQSFEGLTLSMRFVLPIMLAVGWNYYQNDQFRWDRKMYLYLDRYLCMYVSIRKEGYDGRR